MRGRHQDEVAVIVKRGRTVPLETIGRSQIPSAVRDTGGDASHFTCVIQKDSRAEARTATLEERLTAHHARYWPDETTSVAWRSVPVGYMFTEGQQSTSSIVGCVLTHETSLAEREQYMRGVCDLWTDITGCTDHEIVVAITETDPA